MNYKRAFWGILLVALGVLFLLDNFNWIDADWDDIFTLWPLIFVFWGISLLPVKGFIKLILTLGSLAIGIYLVSTFQHRSFIYYHNESRSEIEWNKSEPFSLLKDSTIKYAELNFDVAAGTFILEGGADELLDFTKWGRSIDYELLQEKNDTAIKLMLDLKNESHRYRSELSRVKMKLSEEIIWDVNFDAGAADVNMEMEDVAVRNINVDGGASSIYFKLGDKYPRSELKIDAGAASIEILVPEDAYCEIHSDAVLASKDFEDFIRIERGLYKTDNEADADQIIIIDVDVAVSSIRIKRY